MPQIDGKPIRLRFAPNLHTFRGRLVSRAEGEPVHAAADLRKRSVVLDSCLLSQPHELRRILVHELFHFAWPRLGNPVRASYVRVLDAELARGAPGELGWSAQFRKEALSRFPVRSRPAKAWRDYVCESFCDSAAWLYSSVATHDEFTLPARYAKIRGLWFAECFRDRKLFI